MQCIRRTIIRSISEYWDKYEVNMKKVLCYVALFCMDNTFFVFLLHKKVQIHKK